MRIIILVNGSIVEIVTISNNGLPMVEKIPATVTMDTDNEEYVVTSRAGLVGRFSYYDAECYVTATGDNLARV